MKIIGQPADYSEILQRVFWFSMATGIVCTFFLAKVSPAVQDILDSVKTEVGFGPIKTAKALYILFPAVIALLSRIIKLHDRISDILRIRFVFDTRYYLFPLCEGANVTLTKSRKKKIKQTRNQSMYEVVYKYAGFKNPVIDDQLVRTAADNWGWFWVLIESSFLFSFSALIFVVLKKWSYAQGVLWVILVELILALVQWRACIRSAKPQVAAILSDPIRKKAIHAYFNSL
jgi:hypothetical protein